MKKGLEIEIWLVMVRDIDWDKDRVWGRDRDLIRGIKTSIDHFLFDFFCFVCLSTFRLFKF